MSEKNLKNILEKNKPERPKDKVKRPEEPPARSRAPGGPQTSCLCIFAVFAFVFVYIWIYICVCICIWIHICICICITWWGARRGFLQQITRTVNAGRWVKTGVCISQIWSTVFLQSSEQYFCMYLVAWRDNEDSECRGMSEDGSLENCSRQNVPQYLLSQNAIFNLQTNLMGNMKKKWEMCTKSPTYPAAFTNVHL